jgi:RsiW-degrading membrane proteinase PrsW (M82 family)
MAAYARPPARPAADGLRTFATVGMVLFLLLGALALLGYLAWPLMEGGTGDDRVGPDDAVATAAQFGVLAVLCLGLGAALLFQLSRAWRGQAGSRFYPHPALIAVVGLLVPVTIWAGGTILAGPHQAAGYLFPFAAAAAVILPALGVAQWVGRAGWSAREPDAPPATFIESAAPQRGGFLPGRISREDPFATGLLRRVIGLPTWRRMLGALAWGLGGASLLALVGELLLGAVGLLIAAILGLIFVGQDQLQQWGDRLQGGTGALDCGTLQQMVSHPLVIFGLLAALAGMAPLIDEPAKSLGVWLLRNRLAVARDALLYGALAGAGFGMFENVFYNVENLDAWGSTAVLRFGTILMHAFASGLFGLAWFYRRQGERSRFRRYAGGALLTHALWNSSAIAVSVVAVQQVCKADEAALLHAGGPVAFAAVGWLTLLTLVAAGGLARLARQPA